MPKRHTNTRNEIKFNIGYRFDGGDLAGHVFPNAAGFAIFCLGVTQEDLVPTRFLCPAAYVAGDVLFSLVHQVTLGLFVLL